MYIDLQYSVLLLGEDVTKCLFQLISLLNVTEVPPCVLHHSSLNRFCCLLFYNHCMCAPFLFTVLHNPRGKCILVFVFLDLQVNHSFVGLLFGL